MKKWMILLALLYLGSIVVSGQVPPGVGAASFSRVGIDARPLAMGGAYVAVKAATPIPYYNPAGLVFAAPISVGGMYSEPFGEELGIAFQSLNAVGKLSLSKEPPQAIGIGATLIQLTIDDIPLWDETNPGSSAFFTATSAAYMISAGIPLLDDWAVGASVKLYQEDILEGQGRGVGFDVGLIGSIAIDETPITLGLNAMDVGRTRIRWRGTEGEPDNYVTWTNKVGVAAKFWEQRVLVSGEFDWAVGRPAREQAVHVGIEVNPLAPVFIRGGMKSDLEGKLSVSAGLGLMLLDRFSLDYAYVPGRDLGATHVLSIQVAFFRSDE